MSGHEFWEDAIQPNTFLDPYSTISSLCYLFHYFTPPHASPSDPKEDNADVWVDFDKPTFYSAREYMVESNGKVPLKVKQLHPA